MKKGVAFILLLVALLLLNSSELWAQCSVCTKSAQQMGEKPALGLNRGILYLMLSPFIIVGVIGFRWWKNNKQIEAQEQLDRNKKV